MVVLGLERHYGQDELESSIVHIIEILTLRRNGHESIDEAISRFQINRTRANNMPDFDMPVAALAWLFLEAMGIPRNTWPLLTTGFGGKLPTDSDQLHSMMAAIRQQGHIAEHTHAGPRDLYEGMKGAGRHRGHYHTDDGYWQDGGTDENWSEEWTDD